jgi:hypothetical protein
MQPRRSSCYVQEDQHAGFFSICLNEPTCGLVWIGSRDAIVSWLELDLYCLNTWAVVQQSA